MADWLPLSGIRVVDFSMFVPGPFASAMLADLGAEVIKVEPPKGDPGRSYVPVQFDTENRNKRSLALDLKLPGSAPVRERLVRNADVAIEGFRPGVAKRLGIDYDSLKKHNPKLVYCSISGYGQTGPWRERPGHDVNYVAAAGVLAGKWDIQPVMVLFWLENLIVGAYTVARLVLVKEGLPASAFFVVHYGMFCAIHGLFVFALFGPPGGGFGMGALPALVGAALFKQGLFLAAAALAVSHGVSYVTNYLRPRAYEDADARMVMFAPYKRVVALHLVLLLGGSMVQGMGAPLAPFVILIVLKIAIDLGAHLAEHRAPMLREYKALAESAGVAVVAQPQPEAKARPKDINDRPLAHYLGRWRLAPGENAPPGWFAEVFFEQAKGKVAVRLVSQPGGAAGETLQSSSVRGDAARIEWIEVRLRAPGRERILRFTAAGTGGERIALHEVQQPAGNPKAMQARSFSLVR